MSDARLTRELGLSLLARLANDDDFRARFEAAPARALVELGVPAEVVVNLKAGCIERRTLASKETFQRLLGESADKTIDSAMQMVVPQVGFRKRVAAETQTLELHPSVPRVPASEGVAIH